MEDNIFFKEVPLPKYNNLTCKVECLKKLENYIKQKKLCEIGKYYYLNDILSYLNKMDNISGNMYNFDQLTKNFITGFLNASKEYVGKNDQINKLNNENQLIILKYCIMVDNRIPIRELIESNIINPNVLFVNLLNLDRTLKIKNKSDIYDCIWEYIKYDEQILNELINSEQINYNEDDQSLKYNWYIAYLIRLMIYPNKDQIKFLLKYKQFHAVLLENKLITCQELLIHYLDNKILAVELIEKNNINIDTEDLKKKLMYNIFQNSSKLQTSEMKRLVKKYKLKLDDKCLEYYCQNEFKNAASLKFLLENGCKMDLKNMCNLILNVRQGSTARNIAEVVLDKIN